MSDSREGAPATETVVAIGATVLPGSLGCSWVIDAEGRTTAISPTVAELLGHRPQELVGRPVLDIVDESARPGLAAALERRRAGIQEMYEVRWQRGDGTSFWALMAATPIHDADGTFAGSFALITDVTARHEAEERAVRRAREHAAVADLGRLALRENDLAALDDAAVRTVSEQLGADVAAVYDLDPSGRMAVAAVHGIPAGAAREVRGVRDEFTPPVDRRTDPGKPLVVPDWEHPDAPPLHASARAIGVRGSVSLAIAGRRTYGALAAAQRTPWTPDEDAIAFLESVANVLAAARDRAAGDDEARRRTLHDVLTGLPNRTLVIDRLEQALLRAETNEHPVGVIVVDVDRFKAVNDALGIEVGDEVLCRTAERLAEVAGPGTAGRLSGDRFVVVCDDLAEEADATIIAGHLVEAVRRPVSAAGERVMLTASVGVAVARGGSSAAADLLRDADTAMERAKLRGRDRFEVFDEAIRARALARARMERDLRGAAARGELFVLHQPIVGLRSGHMAGVEALVRWRHPERGVVGPGDFVPVAEEAGLIGDIGAFVLHEACAHVAGRQNKARLTCHVNLSPRQAADPDLPALVTDALTAAGLPPHQLVLELTESSLMEAGEEPFAILEEIRALGVRLVLDDFGTGYSSLSRLRHFPIDGLKIDRSFVASLDADGSTDALIVAGIVDLARALGLTVVAEGVETSTQLQRLRRTGCGYGQGFLLARPSEPEQIDELLAGPALTPAI